MKSDELSSLLMDSGRGWFNSDGDATIGFFGKPAFSLCFCENGTKIFSGSEGKEATDNPICLVEKLASEGYTALGYISYDYFRYTTLGISASEIKQGEKLPLLFFNFYEKDSFYTSTKDKPTRGPVKASANPVLPTSNISRDEYRKKVLAIKQHISAGDVYQVNLSRKFRFPIPDDPLYWFKDFYRTQPVPFAAFLRFLDFSVVSGSMELFLRKRGQTIVSRPIKGTAPRDSDPQRDRELSEALWKNPKERAENLMIVDLMRNDLGRICRYGSVRVKELFSVKRYSTLFQMESEVQGTLRSKVGLWETIFSTFPPGSVTGAPKREAIKIIDHLEPHFRGPYCGVICLVRPDGDFTMSVAIRTGVITPKGADFWFGGGIVWDSVADAEYEETELKAKAVSRCYNHCG